MPDALWKAVCLATGLGGAAAGLTFWLAAPVVLPCCLWAAVVLALLAAAVVFAGVLDASGCLSASLEVTGVPPAPRVADPSPRGRPLRGGRRSRPSRRAAAGRRSARR